MKGIDLNVCKWKHYHVSLSGNRCDLRIYDFAPVCSWESSHIVRSKIPVCNFLYYDV